MSDGITVGPASGGAHREPGEQLELLATWRLPEAPASLEAHLFWYTRGKGTEDVGVVEVKPLDTPRARGEERIRFRLPGAPYSFSGQLITLGWAVEVVAANGDRARWEFTMAPGGREVLLQQPKHATRVR